MSSNNAKKGANYTTRIRAQNARSKKTSKRNERRGNTGRTNNVSSGKPKAAAHLRFDSDLNHPIRTIHDNRALAETKFAQVLGQAVKIELFGWDADKQILTCGREDITLFCGEEGLGIAERTFHMSLLGIGFTKKESNDHAIIYERSDCKFDPDDATKLGQLSVVAANRTRGKDSGKHSEFSDENVVTTVRDIWAHRKDIKNLPSFYGIQANLARLELSGRDARSVISKISYLFGTTVVSKLLVDPVFLSIVKNGASAMPKKKRKTDLPASSDEENEENLKPSAYSSDEDEDEAESPKKTDWDQLEMNSDEESYNSCDEDSSSDEAALPWTDKDDDEWKPGM